MSLEVPLPVLGSYFVTRDRSTIQNGSTSPTQFLEPNPQRWAMYVWNPGQGAVLLRVHPQSLGITVGGDDLTTSPTFRVFTVRDLGSLVQDAWCFESNPLGFMIGCFEIVWQPPASGLVVGE